MNLFGSRFRQPPAAGGSYREPAPRLWQILLIFPLSLGIVAAALAFLHHALIAPNPPGTTVVNPGFALLMLLAGGAGLYAGGAAIYRWVIPAPVPALPPPPPAPISGHTIPASRRSLLGWCFLLASAQLKMWIVSLFFVGWGLWELAKQERAVWNWRETQGVVLEAKVVSRYLRTNPPRPPLIPELRYQYEVQGRTFESVRVTTGPTLVFASIAEADAFLARHQVGAAIPVRYQPANPAEATLVVSRDGGCWTLLGFGVPMLLLTAYFSWKRRGRSEPNLDIPVVG